MPEPQRFALDMAAPAGGQVLILAPRGRDASVIAEVLLRHGLACASCADLGALVHRLGDEVDGLVVTEEALAGPDLPGLLDWVDGQPPWSDMPVIVLATRQAGRRQADAAAVLARLGNVVLLERPINAETLASAAGSVRRARQRQYQARALLLEQKRIAAELRALNDTLNHRVEARARELDQARETLAFALNSAGMGSWSVDLPDGAWARSPQHDAIFGHATPLPEWRHADLLAHVLEEDRSGVEQAFRAALHTGSLDLECRIRRADGAVRWIAKRGRVSYAPPPAEGGPAPAGGASPPHAAPRGVPVRMAGVVMDITERHDIEDALHQAQKMEAIGQLTGGVAHDFNNLLTVIVGGLDMVIRRPEQTERVRRLATAAMSAARRGEQLTQQLLAFSRRQMLRPEILDPNRLLRSFEPLAQRAVGEAVHLVFELDPGAGPIRIDPAQFESAVLNLMVNARDAMPAGGRMTVQTSNIMYRRASDVVGGGALARAGLALGAYVAVAVSDTGTGIDPATLARAFEPFFTTKEVGRGSGLGLSQVYGFVRSAGGTVDIESELGRGTTVRLFFPRSTEVAAEERQAAAPSQLRPALHGETILLVEDDEQVLAMAIDSLEEMHYNVVVARNAREALEHLAGGVRIDIMFSDVVMPGGMNGTELAKKARLLRPGMKVLLTSGYVGGVGAAADAGQEIARDVPVLTKPYRRDELARTLRLVLAGR